MLRTRPNDGYVTTVGWCKNEMGHSPCGIRAVLGVVDWLKEVCCDTRRAS